MAPSLNHDPDKAAHVEEDSRHGTYLVYERESAQPGSDPDKFDLPVESRYVNQYVTFTEESKQSPSDSPSQSDRTYVELVYVDPETGEAVEFYRPRDQSNVTSRPVGENDWFFLDRNGIKYKRKQSQSTDQYQSYKEYSIKIERELVEQAIEDGLTVYVIKYRIKDGGSANDNSRYTNGLRAVELRFAGGDDA